MEENTSSSSYFHHPQAKHSGGSVAHGIIRQDRMYQGTVDKHMGDGVFYDRPVSAPPTLSLNSTNLFAFGAPTPADTTASGPFNYARYVLYT